LHKAQQFLVGTLVISGGTMFNCICEISPEQMRTLPSRLVTQEILTLREALDQALLFDYCKLTLQCL
jgi:hypothetical protein